MSIVCSIVKITHLTIYNQNNRFYLIIFIYLCSQIIFYMKSNKEYRKSACESLKGHWSQAATATLILFVIISLSSLADFIAFRLGTPKIIESFNTLYTVLLIMPATFALIVIFLRLIRKPSTNLVNSFSSHFVSNYGRAVVSILLLSIICTLFAVAGILVSIAIASIPFSLLKIPFGWTSLFELHSWYGVMNIFRSVNLLIYLSVIGFIFMFTIIPMLRYLYKICLFPYIIEDNPDVSIRDSYHHSKVLMVGHRKQLFLLDLSFVGWYLLSILTIGIALLWIVPYHQTARAHFYNDLKEAYDKNQYLSIH